MSPSSALALMPAWLLGARLATRRLLSGADAGEDGGDAAGDDTDASEVGSGTKASTRRSR